MAVVESLSVADLVTLADRLLDEFVGELARREVQLETYNDKQEIVTGLAPFQRDLYKLIIHAGLAGNEEFATLVTRQSGKTESVILAVLALVVIKLHLLKESYGVGIFAPARSQAIEVDRERLRDRVAQLSEFLRRHGIKHDPPGGGKTVKNFYFYSGAHTFRCRMESVDPEAEIKGATMNLLLFEQPEDMNESKIKNDVFPMGAAVRGSKIFNGTPTTGVNNPYFYNLCVRKTPALKVDWVEAGKWRPGYLETVLKQREEMGEDDPAFRSQYGLEWIPGLAKFTDPTDVEAHMLNTYTPDFVYRRRAMGVDWAKQQDDTAALVWEQCNSAEHKDRNGQTCNHLHLLALHEEHGVNYPEQTDRLVDFAKFWKITRTCDDAVGAGDPNNDYLTQSLRGISEVEGLTLTTTMNDNICNLFAREWNAKRLWLPKPESFEQPPYTTLFNEQERTTQKRLLKKLTTQLCDLEREYSSSKLNLHHPEGTSYHDDFPKSGMYGVYATVRLATSPPAAAYTTIDTRPETLQEQDRNKEIVKQISKPFQSWGES